MMTKNSPNICQKQPIMSPPKKVTRKHVIISDDDFFARMKWLINHTHGVKQVLYIGSTFTVEVLQLIFMIELFFGKIIPNVDNAFGHHFMVGMFFVLEIALAYALFKIMEDVLDHSCMSFEYDLGPDGKMRKLKRVKKPNNQKVKKDTMETRIITVNVRIPEKESNVIPFPNSIEN